MNEPLILNRLKIIFEFIHYIPKEYNPRIGGSCALYCLDLVDNFNDVDIICDSIPKLEIPNVIILSNKHKRHLNITIPYLYKRERIEVHSSLTGIKSNNSIIESVNNILKARILIKNFLKEEYNEELEKWKNL